MSLLIVATGVHAAAEGEVLQDALAMARRQGFGSPIALDGVDLAVRWFATPDNRRGSGACVRRGERAAAYVGSLHWKGLTGEPLLDRLLDDFADPRDMPLHDFSGTFALFLRSAAGTWLFNDAVGIQKIYEVPGRQLISTSLMVCRSALRRPGVNRVRAQEYVLFGGTHALEMPVDGIRLLDPVVARGLDGSPDRVLFPAADWTRPCPFAAAPEAGEALANIIVDDFTGMVGAFGADIGMALSAGFDSRLILAGLDRAGVRPTLFVYGDPHDEDVRVAEAIAGRLQLPIQSFDKTRIEAAKPPLDRATLLTNLYFLDGIPNEGIFDRGSDRETRRLQMHDGRLNLNGGGGEIFRNFFYLPDRAYRSDDLVGAFYSNWLTEAVFDRDERRLLLETLQDGILHNLGHAAGDAAARRRVLTRAEVELVYALFRVRYWMGRNNAVMALHGAFLTPLLHPRLVTLAASLPMAWKNYGVLEADLIRRIAPRVAAGPTGYGFAFDQGPDAAYRRKMALTHHRPLALRRRAAPLRRLLGKTRAPDLPAEWRDAAGTDAQVDWIDARHLTDLDQLGRLMSLKVFLSDAFCLPESQPRVTA